MNSCLEENKKLKRRGKEIPPFYSRPQIIITAVVGRCVSFETFIDAWVVSMYLHTLLCIFYIYGTILRINILQFALQFADIS